MPFNYRWARGEKKAIELAEKVSGTKSWHQMETIATCGSVKGHLYEFWLEGDGGYHQYWLLYQYTDKYPKTSPDDTIGFCTLRDFPHLPIQRLKDGLEKIYK